MFTKLNEKYEKGTIGDIFVMSVISLVATTAACMMGMVLAYGLTFGYINLFAYFGQDIVLSFASYGAVFGAILGYFWGGGKEEK